MPTPARIGGFLLPYTTSLINRLFGALRRGLAWDRVAANWRDFGRIMAIAISLCTHALNRARAIPLQAERKPKSISAALKNPPG